MTTRATKTARLLSTLRLHSAAAADKLPAAEVRLRLARTRVGDLDAQARAAAALSAPELAPSRESVAQAAAVLDRAQEDLDRLQELADRSWLDDAVAAEETVRAQDDPTRWA